MAKARFDWDQDKDDKNQKKHGVSFALAQLAFADLKRVIAEDLAHGSSEQRYYCFGQVGADVLTGSLYLSRGRNPHPWSWLLA